MVTPGDIVWIEVKGYGGIKDRPVVVLQVFLPAGKFRACAITSTPKHPIPATYVPLRWAANGYCGTGLNRPSWAVTTWVELLNFADVRKHGKRVDVKELTAIFQRGQS